MGGCHNIHALFHGLFHASFTIKPIQALILCLRILLFGCSMLYFMFVNHFFSLSAYLAVNMAAGVNSTKVVCVCVRARAVLKQYPPSKQRRPSWWFYSASTANLHIYIQGRRLEYVGLYLHASYTFRWYGAFAQLQFCGTPSCWSV